MIADQIEPTYTVRDVAEQYKVTPQTVYNWINDGRIQCLRLTGTVRFRPKHLEEFELHPPQSSSLSNSRENSRSWLQNLTNLDCVSLVTS